MNVSLQCRCGAVRGVADNVSPTAGIRVVCTCDDCQAYAHYLGNSKLTLDEHGGTDIYQMAPAHFKITHGKDQIRLLQLKEKGLFRWYAGCCKTPIANSLHSAKMPFIGVVHTIMNHSNDGVSRDQALGPIRWRNFGKFGIGKLPAGTSSITSFGYLFRFLRFLLSGKLHKAYSPSPFFDEITGKPIVNPYVLTRDERENLRKFCGPNQRT